MTSPAGIVSGYCVSRGNVVPQCHVALDAWVIEPGSWVQYYVWHRLHRARGYSGVQTLIWCSLVDDSGIGPIVMNTFSPISYEDFRNCHSHLCIFRILLLRHEDYSVWRLSMARVYIVISEISESSIPEILIAWRLAACYAEDTQKFKHLCMYVWNECMSCESETLLTASE